MDKEVNLQNTNIIGDTLSQIKQIIMEKLLELGLSENLLNKIKSDNIFDIPSDPTHGDFTTNVAMICAKELKMNPRELAQKIVDGFALAPLSKTWGGVGGGGEFEIAGPGFINIKLSDEIRMQYIKNISYIDNVMRKNNFYNRDFLSYIKVDSKWTSKKVLIEYTDPNPFKIFHIGHLVQNTAGESASRLLDIGGANLRRLCYQGDVGMHVAKTIWGMRQLNKNDYKDELEWYAAGYVYGSRKYIDDFINAETQKDIDDNQKNIEDIKTINKQIYNNDVSIANEYEFGYNLSMKMFDEMYNLLGTKFDDFIRESMTAKIGEPIVRDYLAKTKYFISSDGAIVNNVEVTGMHTRVFINSQGLPTYEAKDIGNFKYKIFQAKQKWFNPNWHLNQSEIENADLAFDYSIVSTGNEIDEYFKLINKVIGLIYPEYNGKQIHISNGMLRLTTGKMSSRKGSVVPATEMIDDMTEAILEKVDEEIKNEIENDEDLKNKYKYLAINAFKFNFLKQAMGKDVIYDREKAIDVNGDSGMYVNYTYARVKSLLDKAKAQNYVPSFYTLKNKDGLIDIVYNANSNRVKSVQGLERVMSQYNYVMERAVNNLEPHRVAQYALELCHEINKFYNDNKVLDNDRSKDKTEYILAILDVSAVILKSLLYALGMRAVDSV
mgnify:CR=1 FL=1